MLTNYFTATVLMVMTNLLWSSIPQVSGAIAYAGSNTARLSCKTLAKSTPVLRLTGEMPDSADPTIFTITNEASKITFNDSIVTKPVYVIEDLKKGVFSVVARNTEAQHRLTLYAIPKTVRAKITDNSLNARFDAIVTTSNPVKPVEILGKLRFICAYDYEI